jgi:hypothetical protein
MWGLFCGEKSMKIKKKPTIKEEIEEYKRDRKEKPIIDREAENKRKLDTWAKKSIPLLQQYGYLEEKSSYSIGGILLGIFVLLIFCGGVGAFIYFGVNDYFKPTLISDCVCPEVIIPESPACPSCNCPTPNINVSFTIPKDLSLDIVTLNVTNGSG